MKFCSIFRGFPLIIVIFTGFFSTFPALAGEENIEFERKEITILSNSKKFKFDVEIAQTDRQRERGLMFRKKMPFHQGMLFLFNENQNVIMWMKNTYIPLDILFIDQNGVIVTIARSTTPESLDHIPSRQPVISVLELNAGVTQNLNIQVGDKIKY